jgi:hypothetical protein
MPIVSLDKWNILLAISDKIIIFAWQSNVCQNYYGNAYLEIFKTVSQQYESLF